MAHHSYSLQELLFELLAFVKQKCTIWDHHHPPLLVVVFVIFFVLVFVFFCVSVFVFVFVFVFVIVFASGTQTNLKLKQTLENHPPQLPPPLQPHLGRVFSEKKFL